MTRLSTFERKIRMDSMRELESIRTRRRKIREEIAALKQEDKQLSTREHQPRAVLKAFGVNRGRSV